MENKIEKDAYELRKQFGYNNESPIPFKRLLQNQNVITFFKKLPDSLSGMSIKSGANRFMLINCNNPVGRQNFTISHELYHLFVDNNFKPHLCTIGSFDKKNNRNEYYADYFASHFLVPDDGLRKNIPDDELNKNKITLQTILKLEHLFQCSRTMLLYKLINLKVVTPAYAENFKLNIAKSARQNGFSTKLYFPSEEEVISGDYGVLANKLYTEEIISEGHYYSLMQNIGVDILQSFIENGDK